MTMDMIAKGARMQVLKLIISVAVVWLWLTWAGSPRAEDTIHTWTDEQGVRHFSDSEPMEDGRNPEIYIQGGNETPSSNQEARRRSSFDNMVESARIEANRLEQERKQAEAERKRRQKEEAEQRRQAAIEAKRGELQKKIDALMNRALSRTFSQGMRDNQIKAIQEQIDQLEK